jgi:hypothetical protein
VGAWGGSLWTRTHRTQKDPKGPVLDWERNGLIGPIKKKKRPTVGGCKADSILNPHGLRPFLRHFWPIKRLGASSGAQKTNSAPNAGRTRVGPRCECFNGRTMPISSPFETLARFPAVCFSALKWWLPPIGPFYGPCGSFKTPSGSFWVLLGPFTVIPICPKAQRFLFGLVVVPTPLGGCC